MGLDFLLLIMTALFIGWFSNTAGLDHNYIYILNYIDRDRVAGHSYDRNKTNNNSNCVYSEGMKTMTAVMPRDAERERLHQ